MKPPQKGGHWKPWVAWGIVLGGIAVLGRAIYKGASTWSPPA